MIIDWLSLLQHGQIAACGKASGLPLHHKDRVQSIGLGVPHSLSLCFASPAEHVSEDGHVGSWMFCCCRPALYIAWKLYLNGYVGKTMPC